MQTEKILNMGPQGAGKTFQLLQIAKYLQPTGAQFYVLDTDDSYPRSMEEFPGLAAEEGGNVHVTFPWDWEDYVSWLFGMNRIAGGQLPSVPGVLETAQAGRDWLVVDRIDKAWSRVQNFVSEEVYGMDLAGRLLEAKKRMQGQGKSGMSVSGVDKADWQVINAQYMGWQMALLYKARCHVYMTTATARVRGDDGDEIKGAFEPLGVKPAGQKTLPYEAHTILFSQWKNKQYLVTTAKDRGGRVYFDQANLIDLSKQYLVPQGGWSNKPVPVAAGVP